MQAESTSCCVSSKENTDPLPYSLVTSSRLPILPSSCAVIASPSPVPSIFRFFSSSTRRNASVRCSMSSVFIPMPESATPTFKVTVSSVLSKTATCRHTNPFLVYFTALESRLNRICRMRTSSPSSLAGISGSACTSRSRFLVLALTRIRLHASHNSFATS